MESSAQQQQQNRNIQLVSPSRAQLQPFMRRGVTLRNGVRFGFKSLLCLTVGGVLLLVIAGASGSFFFMILGALTLASGCYLCYLASQQYKALPPDHPERLQYSPGSAVTGQDVPLGAVVYSPQAPGAGSPMVYQGPQQNQPGYTIPVLAATQPGSYPVPPGGQTGSYPVPVAGYSGGLGGPDSYKDDLPPAYEDIVKSSQYP